MHPKIHTSVQVIPSYSVAGIVLDNKEKKNNGFCILNGWWWPHRSREARPPCIKDKQTHTHLGGRRDVDLRKLVDGLMLPVSWRWVCRGWRGPSRNEMIIVETTTFWLRCHPLCHRIRCWNKKYFEVLDKKAFRFQMPFKRHSFAITALVLRV